MLKIDHTYKPDLVIQHYELEKKQAMQCLEEILYSYSGIPEKIMVDEVASEIESVLLQKSIPKKYIKAIFSIIVEMLQNINIHGEKDVPVPQKAYALITSTHDYFSICSGNLIKEEFVKKTEGKINHINTLSPEELKSYYLQVLSDGSMSHKGGAGLGLITLAIKSGQKISYSFHSLNNEYSLLKLKIQVNLNP